MISPALPYLTLVLEPVLADQLQLLVQASLVEGPPRHGVNLEYLSRHCPFLPITTMVRTSEESLKGGRVRPLELPGRVWLSRMAELASCGGRRHVRWCLLVLG